MNIKNNRSTSLEKADGILTRKYPEIFNLMNAMIAPKIKIRPDCKDVLDKRNLWLLEIDEMNNDINLKEILNEDSSIEDSFHKYFLQKKFRFK